MWRVKLILLNQESTMNLQLPATRRPNPAARRSTRTAEVDPESKSAARMAWEIACAQRLHELRRCDEPASIALVAAQLWTDVGRFDPLIAAEMEHESWL
jgi:hypothetical protein